MPIFTLLLTALLVQTPPEPAPGPDPAEPSLPNVEGDGDPDDASSAPGFFATEVESSESSGSAAPPMPEIEQLPSRDPDLAPPAEADPSDAGSDEGSPAKRPVIVFDPAREAAGSEGGSFFDPGKLGETGPGGGGIVQLRGFVGASFITTERTNIRQMTDAGNFERVEPLPFFGAGTATLYVGAAIWADAVYARISLEYLSIPTVTSGTEDILAPANRQLLVESAALEINPFFWAKQTPRWFREGFKLTAGVFIVPFGIEDEEHAAPVNWFTTRARSMTNGRVYPGTWSDVGAVLKFRPSFREHNTIRPIEIDIGLVNGDPCTQTRWTDSLYNPTGVVAPCERVRRPQELVDGANAGAVGADPRADLGFLGVGPDNNQNKSLIARLSVFPLADLQLGGSLAWGRHPRLLDFDERAAGRTTIDVPQAASWRAGAHLALDLDRMISSAYPLPMMRGEFIVGSDAAPKPREAQPDALADRWVMGGYAQIAQPLYRRKGSNLPGVMLQYRIDWANPDAAVPGIVAGPGGDVPLVSDHADAYLYDETQLGHSFGLRWLVVPRFTIKADYTLIREDGGRANQLYNDRFVFQMVGDF
ncbi:hypothetical protein DB30_06620 [Enhygromyxa salina]|uniref:Phosphate-selective porin O and P n=1 Tax=Enhygromyxa salina TaxID=215803 RepID=A0A0C2CY30_9BACT|nr:hypothetical protein [Enhygromyxa salina]KIG14565.1 hypothetical protein DB30_06620 [Enhygromyxa salina]